MYMYTYVYLFFFIVPNEKGGTSACISFETLITVKT